MTELYFPTMQMLSIILLLLNEDFSQKNPNSRPN